MHYDHFWSDQEPSVRTSSMVDQLSKQAWACAMAHAIDHWQGHRIVQSWCSQFGDHRSAFLADGLETLEELDIGIREQFMELGGEHFEVIRCLNDDQEWIEGMSSIVSEKFQLLN